MERVCGAPETMFDVATPADLVEIEGCTSIAGSLRIGDTQFVELAGLDRLRVVEGSLNLFRNAALVDLGLSQLERVGGTLSVHFDDRLDSVALPSLQAVGGLLISSNASLSSPGLDALDRVDGDLRILNNPRMPRAEAEAFAAQIDVGGTVEISP